MTRYVTLTLVLLFAAGGQAAATTYKRADAGLLERYPELAMGRLLPQITDELKRSFPDPYSIKDFVMCPASNVRTEDDGEPPRLKSWYVPIAFNARGPSGGYEGKIMYGAIFRPGKRVQVTRIQMASQDGLDGVINREIEKSYVDCPTIAEDQIQELLKPNTVRLDIQR